MKKNNPSTVRKYRLGFSKFRNFHWKVFQVGLTSENEMKSNKTMNDDDGIKCQKPDCIDLAKRDPPPVVVFIKKKKKDLPTCLKSRSQGK